MQTKETRSFDPFLSLYWTAALHRWEHSRTQHALSMQAHVQKTGLFELKRRKQNDIPCPCVPSRAQATNVPCVLCEGQVPHICVLVYVPVHLYVHPSTSISIPVPALDQHAYWVLFGVHLFCLLVAAAGMAIRPRRKVQKTVQDMQGMRTSNLICWVQAMSSPPWKHPWKKKREAFGLFLLFRFNVFLGQISSHLVSFTSFCIFISAFLCDPQSLWQFVCWGPRNQKSTRRRIQDIRKGKRSTAEQERQKEKEDRNKSSVK